MQLRDLRPGQKFVLARTGKRYKLINHGHERCRSLVKPVGWIAPFYPRQWCTLSVLCEVRAD